MNGNGATLSSRRLLLLVIALFGFGLAQALTDLPRWVSDLSRAYVLIVGVAIVSATLAITHISWRNYRIAPDRVLLLPRHVIQMISFVVALLIVVAVIVIGRVATQPQWFTLSFLLPAMAVGALGLWDTMRWLPDRRKELFGPVDRNGVPFKRRSEDRRST